MYGLLLQSASSFLRNRYGEDVFAQICQEANIPPAGFSTHKKYSEKIMTEMGLAAAKITGAPIDNIMDNFGVEFVDFVGQFGYDRILKVLGRNMRDFLNGLDNLHEYLRFSYPKLKPPSFFVNDETKNGLTLIYRSKRQGYLHYVKGQIRQVGKVFYKTRVDIFVVANDFFPNTGTTHVKFRLLFDNKAFRDLASQAVDDIVDSIPLRPELLFDLFPFHIVFSRKMDVRSLGPGLKAVLPSAVGQNLAEIFTLERPLTNFTWEDILHHTNNVFVLVARPEFQAVAVAAAAASHVNGDPETPGEAAASEDHSNGTCPIPPHSKLQLKGQMMYMSEWDSIMFLGTPIMNSLDDMFKIGLYINDLSMHDSSRDLVLAGTQQSAELKLALDQEQEKSRLLEQSMVKLNKEMQRTDALLYQMIPKPVADRLRRGEPSVETCQVFESVTILFSDVVGFTTICSQITPMEVVSMLNSMYTQFDYLSENHSVYKVETIGDAYMAVSGAPTITRFHALHMCDMALDMRESMSALVNPASNESMKIRIGVHTGTTVAGVVGIKMPRYCLFGDTVNTASRMETSGEAMKIHISETTKKELENYPYEMQERGSIQVKGKGTMKTYWLRGKKDIPESEMPQCPFLAIMQEEVRSRRAEEANDKIQVSDNMGSQTALHSYSPVSFKDMRMDAASPLGHAGSGAAAAAGLLGLEGNPQHHYPAEFSSRSRAGSLTGTPGRAPTSACPFSSGMLEKSPHAISTPMSINTARGKGTVNATIENGSVAITSSTSQPNPTRTDTNSSSQTRRGLTSLDSGISISGSSSTQQEVGGSARDAQVPKVNVYRPNQAPTTPSQNEHPTATIPNSHDNMPSAHITKPNDNTQNSYTPSAHSTRACCTPPSQSIITPAHTNPSGFSANNNDTDHIYRSVEERVVEGQSKMPSTENGSATVEAYNTLNSDAYNSKNGTHALRKDEGLMSASSTSKSNSSKKSKMCAVL